MLTRTKNGITRSQCRLRKKRGHGNENGKYRGSVIISKCLCKRGFGSPRIWIPHPKTLADLDEPKRGLGSPADLDPSIYFVCDIASRMMTSNVGRQIRGHLIRAKRGFGSPADLDHDSQRIVEDLFRQVSMSLAHSD